MRLYLRWAMLPWFWAVGEARAVSIGHRPRAAVVDAGSVAALACFPTAVRLDSPPVDVLVWFVLSQRSQKHAQGR